tara:strand:+ start:748 stop:1005 length:258 start_codon:yes stop_codon:yes gene_type:complete
MIMDTKDIVLGIIGFGISIYGGQTENLVAVVIGILIIILTIVLTLQNQEEDIKILKAQINTQFELKKVWRTIDELRNDKKQKRQG